MGNYASCMAVGMKEEETIQLVSSEGTVKTLKNPLSAGQIIQEFPEHLVCHSDSFYIGKKTPALSANDQLEVGNKYFLLPDKFFHSPLSLILLASFVSPPSVRSPSIPNGGVSASLRSIERASSVCEPLEIEKSADVGGGLRIRVSPGFITKLMEDGRPNVVGDSIDNQRRLCNTLELQKDYEQLVTLRSGKCWSPKLETIKEKEKGICQKLIFKIRR